MKDYIDFVLCKFYHINNISLKKYNSIYYFFFNGKYFQFFKIDNVMYFSFLLKYIKIQIGCPNFYLVNNINNDFLSFYDSTYFALIQFEDNNICEKIDVEILNPIVVNSNDYLLWNVLWEHKVNYYERIYFEKLINVDFFKDSFFYFVGLAENAISYFKYNISEFDLRKLQLYLCHYRITSDNYFNIFNFKVDYRSRDIAELIKLAFFDDNINFDLSLILSKLNYIDALLLFSRVLFPTFYFDYIDSYLDNEDERERRTTIFNLTFYKRYENFLMIFYNKISGIFSIPEVNWIKKRML